MYQLMAKWEELNKNMAPAYRISGQIKDIKRLLDLFEAALNWDWETESDPWLDHAVSLIVTPVIASVVSSQ